MKRHDAQTKSSLVNIRFATWIPGFARNLYSSWESDIILDFVLLILSVNLPKIELRQSLFRPRFAALGLIVILSSWITSLA